MHYAPSITSPVVDDDELADLLALRRDLNEDELATMMSRIKPVVRGGEKLFYVDIIDVYENYLCEPRHLGAVANDLVALCTITTLHHFGDAYYGFCPKPAEVYAMIQPDQLSVVRAFEVRGPEDEADLNRQLAAGKRHFHAATTVLYA